MGLNLIGVAAPVLSFKKFVDYPYPREYRVLRLRAANHPIHSTFYPSLLPSTGAIAFLVNGVSIVS